MTLFFLLGIGYIKMSISSHEHITTSNLRQIIRIHVNLKPGLKTTELIPEIYKEIYELSLTVDNDVLLKEINNMIHEKELVEVNYVLPDMNYRQKQILFPKGTLIV